MSLAALEKRAWRAMELRRRGRINSRTEGRELKPLRVIAPERCRQLLQRRHFECRNQQTRPFRT